MLGEAVPGRSVCRRCTIDMLEEKLVLLEFLVFLPFVGPTTITDMSVTITQVLLLGFINTGNTCLFFLFIYCLIC